MMRSAWTAEGRWLREPDISAWVANSRLNLLRALPDHAAEPSVQAAVNFTHLGAARDRLKQLDGSDSAPETSGSA
jgi:hypothetical protein